MNLFGDTFSKIETMENKLNPKDFYYASRGRVYVTKEFEQFCTSGCSSQNEFIPRGTLPTYCGWNAVMPFPDISEICPDVRSLENLGDSAHHLTHADISQLKTSELRAVQNLFFSCDNLKTIDMSGLDLHRVAVFANLFSCCSQLCYINLANTCLGNEQTRFGNIRFPLHTLELNLDGASIPIQFLRLLPENSKIYGVPTPLVTGLEEMIEFTNRLDQFARNRLKR